MEEKVKEVGEELRREQRERFGLGMGVLKGGVGFMGDVIKDIDRYLEMELMDV